MRIGWIAIGNKNTGSTRNFVLNTHSHLSSLNIHSVILSLNEYYSSDILNNTQEIKNNILKNNLTHVIFQKVLGVKAKELVLFCKEKNIKTIYNNGDWYYDEFYKEFDLIFVGSSYIKDILKNKYKIRNVEVMYDMVEKKDCFFKNHTKKNNLTLGWFGNKGKLNDVSGFIEKLSLPISYEILTISNTTSKDIKRAKIEMGDGTNTPWDVDILYDILYKLIDVLIVPVPVIEENKLIHYAKTANRLFPALQLGIPILCSPIPSYKELITNNINGILCNTQEDWIENLNKMKNPLLRNKIAKEGIKLLDKFYPEKVIQYFIEKIK